MEDQGSEVRMGGVLGDQRELVPTRICRVGFLQRACWQPGAGKDAPNKVAGEIVKFVFSTPSAVAWNVKIVPEHRLDAKKKEPPHLNNMRAKSEAPNDSP